MYVSIVFLAAILCPIIGMIPLMRKSVSPYRVVTGGAVAGTVAALAVMIAASLSGQSIYEEMQESMQYMAETMANDQSLMQAMQMSEMKEAQRIAFFEQTGAAGTELMPSSVGVLAAVSAYVEYLLISKVMKAGTSSGTAAIVPMPPFREFSLPRNAVIGFVGIYLLSWLFTEAQLVANDMLSINISVLFNFVFCLQGIAVIFMFCYKKRAPKVIAVIVVLFFFFSTFGKWALFLLGMMDLIFSIRTKLR